MISKLKAYGLALLGVLAAVFAALFYRERANYKGAQLDGEKAAREVENKATDAMIEGLEAENEIKNDNTTNRDKFLD